MLAAEGPVTVQQTSLCLSRRPLIPVRPTGERWRRGRAGGGAVASRDFRRSVMWTVRRMARLVVSMMYGIEEHVVDPAERC
jgi:hypothetical protein